jgi:hypothetical protein
MVRNKIANRATVMGSSIRMIMECKSQDRERKANEEEIEKFFTHQSTEIRLIHLQKKIKDYISPIKHPDKMEFRIILNEAILYVKFKFSKTFQILKNEFYTLKSTPTHPILNLRSSGSSSWAEVWSGLNPQCLVLGGGVKYSKLFCEVQRCL